jgi:hypothetical protein
MCECSFPKDNFKTINIFAEASLCQAKDLGVFGGKRFGLRVVPHPEGSTVLDSTCTRSARSKLKRSLGLSRKERIRGRL